MPRSARFTSPVSGIASCRYAGVISNARRSSVRVADEQAAALVRLVQPLVRVERDRVRAADAVERAPSPLGQHREAAVRRVDVQPQPVRVAQPPPARAAGRPRRCSSRRRSRRRRTACVPRARPPRSRGAACPARGGSRRRPAARAPDRAGSRARGRRARATSAPDPRRTRRGGRSSRRRSTPARPRAPSCSPPSRR